MNEWPSNSVSVIIPAFNSGTYIERAIRSVELQKKPSDLIVEIIVVDDCSTESTMISALDRIQAASSPMIRLIRLKKNGGAARARNEAIANAKGRYLAFLDSDDLWLNNHLQTHIAALRSTSAGFSCSDYNSIDQTDTVYSPRFFHNHKEKSRALKLTQTTSKFIVYRRPVKIFLDCCPACTITTVIDREKFPKELLHFSEDLRMAEDVHLWIRLSAHGDFCFIPDATAGYRTNFNSLTQKSNSFIIDDWLIQALEDLLSKTEFLAWRALIRQRIGAILCSQAYGYRKEGDKTRSFAAIKKAVLISPKSLSTYVELVKLFIQHLRSI
ncbi:glycosyltransferase family 2 protein [Paucibacter sp. KCTC 42545]|uniref:glycosyltransferase family 2 protein n=1 Tax=Paucibacter sp. KCTC 42545 TaxID=1768242 RepID=UPI0009E7C518|nr:glycosyltransferase family 2 protein [Paucibacter sp. KCTC 42545]